MMLGVSRHDITANNHGKGVEGMLVLTELRLLFLPDVGAGSATASFLDFNTVQVTRVILLRYRASGGVFLLRVYVRVLLKCILQVFLYKKVVIFFLLVYCRRRRCLVLFLSLFSFPCSGSKSWR